MGAPALQAVNGAASMGQYDGRSHPSILSQTGALVEGFRGWSAGTAA